jgi:hypothetical protein
VRQSVSVSHDYTQDLAGIQEPVPLIRGRYDRLVSFEVRITILNHTPIRACASQPLRSPG